MQPVDRNAPSTASSANRRHGFNGQGARRKPKPSTSRLRGIRPFDQHGRQWFVETEINSGMPTGRWQPLFEAPWYPDQTYFVINVENVAEMYIDYPRMRQERQDARVGYHSDAVQFATEHKMPTPVFGQAYDAAIIASIGRPPQPVQPIIAAEQENPWIMGWSARPDPRIVPHMPRRRNALSVDEAGYDFSEASYREAIAQAPRTVKSLAELPQIVGNFDPPVVGEEVGGVEDDTFDNDEPAPPVGESELLVDADEAGNIFDEGLDPKTEELLDLEDEIDPDVTGGRKVPVETKPQTERAERRPPRPPQVSRQKSGKPAPPTFPTGAPRATPGSKGQPKKSLAQGARPVVQPLDDE